MQSFDIHTGLVAPLDRVNVDTDAIVPKQFLRKIERTGFGKHLFHEWRYLDYEGIKENPDFSLNKPQYRGATILVARDNFGCGSSREHAPWALDDYGFRVIVAPSFADIFYNNCVKNGILLIVLKSKEVDEIFNDIAGNKSFEITADLEKQTISTSTGKTYSFGIDAFAKQCLLKGLDQIGWTEQFEKQISEYEKRNQELKPWLG